MPSLKKIILILLVVNILRIIPGCCECDDTPIPFNFNKLTILNLDNSDNWGISTTCDTMLAEAVAFEIDLFDSTGFFYAQEQSININGLGYARAYSCKCNFPYKANQYLTDVRITSLLPLTSEIEADSDVTDQFVAQPTNNSSSGSSLYISLESMCKQTENKIYYYGSGTESFRIFLKPGITNSKARFVIRAEFSDQTYLSDTTRLITIANR